MAMANYLWWAAAATAGAAALAAGWLAVMVLGQHRRMYRPRRKLEGLPGDVGLAYEDRWLTTADAVGLHAWFLPGPPGVADAPVLLMCHGNGGNISNRLDSYALYHQLGLAVLALEYRGYGRSQGRPGEQGTYLDAAAAWEHLTGQDGVSPARIIILGRSLGAAVAANLAARTAPAGLVLESAFASVPQLAAGWYPFLPVSRLCRFRYDTEAAVRAVRCPVLVLHSPVDETVPFSHAQRIWSAAPRAKWLVELSGQHNDAHRAAAAVYAEALARFIRHCMA